MRMKKKIGSVKLSRKVSKPLSGKRKKLRIQKPPDIDEYESDSKSEEHCDVESEEMIEDDSSIIRDDESSENSDNEEPIEPLNENESTEHKKSLGKLKETDPEFYQFLLENDKKLLAFSEDSDEETDEKIHLPPDSLEGDSEESDFEPEDNNRKKSGKTITMAMVRIWKERLINEPTIENITNVVKGFNAALARVKGEESADYKVEGSAVFNAIVELCVLHMETAVTTFLRLPKHNKHPHKSKKWVKIRSTVQSYLSDLLKLLSGVTSNHIVSVLLKHLHSICYLVICFTKLSRSCLKLMSSLWSSGEESVRVLAYLCILRLATSSSESKNNILDSALKLLYISYVKNTRFVSVTVLPHINFMRRSLADLFTLNPVLSYSHAFLYIRQLAIHLRNAVTVRKKERLQTVYNWQYINSLHLWIELLCSQKEPLNQLSYPLITIILGCIKLIPTSQYVPLRFHCLNMLIKLSRHTDTFIPILPYILETLTIVNLNMKHKKASMKPFDLTCVLRLSKGAMTETAFTDAVVENIYQILLDTCYNHRNSISFPDLMVPVIVQMRTFIKTTKVSKYSSKFKPLLSKIEENSKFITTERNKLSINLCETGKIKAFEANICLKGTPLSKFWDQWNQANVLKRPKKSDVSNEKVGKQEEPIFTIRKDLKRKVKSGEPTVLFPSDDESGEEISTLLCKPAYDCNEDSEEETSDSKKLMLSGNSSDVDEGSIDNIIKDDNSEESLDDDYDDDIVEELNLSKF